MSLWCALLAICCVLHHVHVLRACHAAAPCWVASARTDMAVTDR